MRGYWLILLVVFTAEVLSVEWRQLPQSYCDGYACVALGGYCARPANAIDPDDGALTGYSKPVVCIVNGVLLGSNVHLPTTTVTHTRASRAMSGTTVRPITTIHTTMPATHSETILSEQNTPTSPVTADPPVTNSSTIPLITTSLSPDTGGFELSYAALRPYLPELVLGSFVLAVLALLVRAVYRRCKLRGCTRRCAGCGAACAGCLDCCASTLTCLSICCWPNSAPGSRDEANRTRRPIIVVPTRHDATNNNLPEMDPLTLTPAVTSTSGQVRKKATRRGLDDERYCRSESDFAESRFINDQALLSSNRPEPAGCSKSSFTDRKDRPYSVINTQPQHDGRLVHQKRASYLPGEEWSPPVDV